MNQVSSAVDHDPSLPEPGFNHRQGSSHIEKSAPMNEETSIFMPPDGGRRAWSCVLGSFLLQFCSFGYINACGIFQQYYASTLLPDQSASSLAWITTLQTCFIFFFSPFVGQVVDIFGAHFVTIPSSILAVFCVCMLSLCKSYWQVILAQGIGFGIASSGLVLSASVLATQWFSTRRGLATGLASSGSSLGGVIYPFMIPNMIKSVGFAGAVRYTALMQGVLLIIANILISAPFKLNAGRQKTSFDISDFRSLPWLTLASGCFLFMWGQFTPHNYLPEMASQFGVKTSLSQYSAALVNAGSCLGRVTPGFLSDRIGPFNMMSLVTFLSSVFVLAFWIPLTYSPSLGGIYAFALLYGFVSGGWVSLGPLCVAALNKGQVEKMGVQFGGYLFVAAFGALTGLPIEGAIRDAGGPGHGWVSLMAFTGIALFLGCVFTVVTRVLVGGWSLAKKV